MKQSIIPLVFDSSLSLVLPKAFQGLKNIYCVLFCEKFQTNFRLSKKITLEQLHSEKKIWTPSLTTTSATLNCKIFYLFECPWGRQCNVTHYIQVSHRSGDRSGQVTVTGHSACLDPEKFSSQCPLFPPTLMPVFFYYAWWFSWYSKFSP